MESYLRTLDVESRNTVQQNRMTFWQDGFGGDDKCNENVNDCAAFAKQNRSTNENDNRNQRRATKQNFGVDHSSGDDSEVDTDEQEETKERERLIADMAMKQFAFERRERLEELRERKRLRKEREVEEERRRERKDHRERPREERFKIFKKKVRKAEASWRRREGLSLFARRTTGASWLRHDVDTAPTCGARATHKSGGSKFESSHLEALHQIAKIMLNL